MELELICFNRIPNTRAFILPSQTSSTKFSKSRVLKLRRVEFCRTLVRSRFVAPAIGGAYSGNEVEVAGGSEEEDEKDSVCEELRREAEKILEWDSICEQVSRFAFTSSGRRVCRNGGLRVGRDKRESEELLNQTEAVTRLPRPLDFSGIEDVTDFVNLANSGEVLGVRELCAVERSLRSARRVYEQLVDFASEEGSRDSYLALLELFRDCNFNTEWVQKIGLYIDSNLFVILDRASSKLESIRSNRRKNMDNLEALLKSISSRIFQSGGIDSPLVTKRRSRMCVGIRASHKALLPDGIVLGISSSGATYFMEPRDVTELNNMEVRLSNLEQAEELVILSKLTAEIASSKSGILHLMEKIQDLDIACARGAHALWMNCIRPTFFKVLDEVKSNEGQEMMIVNIEGLQHPLLLEPSLRNTSSSDIQSWMTIIMDERNKPNEARNLARDEAVIPLDIKIKHNKKVVVISGPNTGGKTVSMKTLGLASLMSKAGLFLPAVNHPQLPWFDQILVDIGDHQSLEHNLSTFSGHVSRLCKILNVVSKQSLVLIDEIGNGTDPSEGVALSISILQHLVNRVNLALVTTHYADLSLLKDKDSRFENAAMEFCIKTLKPTYRILWGSTGNSNALNIARSIGFDDEVLSRAEDWVKKLLPDKQKERQGLLYQSLLEERNKLESQAKKANSVLLEIKKLYLEIYSEAEDLARREAALKARESQEVRDEIKYVKSKMDMVAKMFDNQLKCAHLGQFNELMRQAEASIAGIVKEHQVDDLQLEEEERTEVQYTPQVGGQVRVKKLGDKLATVVEALGDDYILVQYGKIRIRVKRSEVRSIGSGTENDPTGAISHIKVQDRKQDLKRLINKDLNSIEGVSYGAAVQTSKNTVDLRGMRVEEASNHLNLAISGCRPRGVLFVIHGMGTGAVKECALEVMKKHPRVAKFEEESPMNYGCTVVFVK